MFVLKSRADGGDYSLGAGGWPVWPFAHEALSSIHTTDYIQDKLKNLTFKLYFSILVRDFTNNIL